MMKNMKCSTLGKSGWTKFQPTKQEDKMILELLMFLPWLFVFFLMFQEEV